MKSTRVPGLIAAGAVGLAGLGIGVVIGPAAASAATSSATHAVGDRVAAIKNALSGLVKDGTLTQDQADKVATTLDQKLPDRGFLGRGGPGMRFGAGLDEAAGIIGISESDLRSQLQSGKTLAEIAKSKGMSQATLVDKLVAAAKSRLASAVTAGRLTQAQADSIGGNLTAQITTLVTSTGPVGGPGRHEGGRRFGGPGMPSHSGGTSDGGGASSTPSTSAWTPASA